MVPPVSAWFWTTEACAHSTTKRRICHGGSWTVCPMKRTPDVPPAAVQGQRLSRLVLLLSSTPSARPQWGPHSGFRTRTALGAARCINDPRPASGRSTQLMHEAARHTRIRCIVVEADTASCIVFRCSELAGNFGATGGGLTAEGPLLTPDLLETCLGHCGPRCATLNTLFASCL